MFPVVENSAIHKHTLITPGQEWALLDDQHASVLIEHQNAPSPSKVRAVLVWFFFARSSEHKSGF